MEWGDKKTTIAGVVLGLLLSGCSSPAPPVVLPDASAVVADLTAALMKGDISGLPFAASAVDPVKDYGVVTAGLGGLLPSSVTAGAIAYDTSSMTATVSLDQTYAFSTPWEFTSVVGLEYQAASASSGGASPGSSASTGSSASSGEGGDGWQIDWAPAIVQPSLDGFTRLTLSTDAPTRGSILADDGTAIVYNRPVYNVGIDKTKVDANQAQASARALAQAVGIDPDAYAKQVANGGPKQFVIAITLRAGQVPDAVNSIAGVLAQESTLSLAPTKTFALGLLGTAGEATAEDIQNSNGTVKQGDTVGHSGLQLSQNAVLAGQTGYTVYIGPRNSGDIMTTSPTVRPTASSADTKQVLYQVKPVDGGNLNTTLDVALQTKAETILAGQSDIASLVVLDATTGAIRVAANSPAAGANSYATTGQYAPGSTLKVSTALALLRSGMTDDSPISCPPSVIVNGAQFTNVSDYAPSHTGTITLRQAVAWSCNTAMVNGSLTLSDNDLTNAAASLGLGGTQDLGFPAYLGSVPVPASNVDKAAEAFGQGKVTMSPLAMATEAASVAAGRTVVPYLLTDASGNPTTSQTSPAAPLTAAEDASLKDIMAAVVSTGTGTILKGLVDGAKTGTAEFTQDGQTQSHAWMIAFTSQYAICAFVNVGTTGADTAGPLIKAFLTS